MCISKEKDSKKRRRKYNKGYQSSLYIKLKIVCLLYEEILARGKCDQVVCTWIKTLVLFNTFFTLTEDYYSTTISVCVCD